MIALTSSTGELVRVIPLPSKDSSQGPIQIGYHPKFGFVAPSTLERRLKRRHRSGFFPTTEEFDFSFEIEPTGTDGAGFSVSKAHHCQVDKQERAGASVYLLRTDQGEYRLGALENPAKLIPPARSTKRDKVAIIGLLLFLLVLGLGGLLQNPPVEAPLEVVETIEVKVVPIKEAVRITVPKEETLPPEIKQDRVAKRAIQQNLGFLGILGKKNLTKALGGNPTQLQDASAGAGPGGKEGSGGELLTGLGAGLKRTTVGNTGVAGLGGIGTKGAGGGLGGYGNASVGSGEGKSLSSVALSNDLMLDGGLDRSVVQATIAKYLSQVRACYEIGLQKNSALVGQVLMNFEINGTGDLNFAKVDRSSVGDKQVEDCIAQRMLTWKFPNPKGGVKVKVSYPFMLRPVKL